MCLSTVYKNQLAPESVVMRNVMSIRCQDGQTIAAHAQHQAQGQQHGQRRTPSFLHNYLLDFASAAGCRRRTGLYITPLYKGRQCRTD